MKKILFFIGFVVLLGCSGTEKKVYQSYALVITVELEGTRKSETKDTVHMDVDTVEASDPVAAYSKGVQRYAAMLMHIQQFPDSISGLKGLMIRDEAGNDVVPGIPQPKRDSVIMNFIQFARRSSIPYYDRVKDFELKLMTAR